MTSYLEPGDDGAFADFVKLGCPSHGKMEGHPQYVECPKCKGYGGWNLELNAYSMHGQENTAENRHKFSHFRQNCSQCNGYGWCDPKDTECIHELAFHKNVGNCLNTHKCTKCGKEETWDSSD